MSAITFYYSLLPERNIHMKKIFMILLLFFTCFILIACEPRSVSYPDDYLEDVIKVELINYDNNKIKRFDVDKMEIIEELNTEKLDDFLQDLSDIYMWRSIPKGYFAGESIRIIYGNGDFEVMSCNNTEHKIISYLVRYDSNGRMIKLIGSVEHKSEFTNILNTYFTTPSDSR